MKILFDIETDGLLFDVTKVHCVGLAVADTKASQVYANDLDYDCLNDALEIMSDAESLTGHNIIGFDLPVLKKVLGWEPRRDTLIEDTLVMSRLVFPNLMDLDSKKPIIVPRKLWGSHSLKAWGYRLGVLKGDFNNGDTDWSTFTDDMANYCADDVSLGALLHTHLCGFEYSGEAVGLEHEFATIIQRQVEQGFKFDVSQGQNLVYCWLFFESY